MKNLFIYKILFLVFFLGGCRKQEMVVPKPVLGDMVVDNNRYTLTKNISSNEDCNSLFLGIMPNDEFPYLVNLRVSKDGNLIHALVVDGQTNFETARFYPLDYFKITSFTYDSVKQVLGISFQGSLFAGTKSKAIEVKGHLNDIPVSPYTCASVFSYLKGKLENNNRSDSYYSSLGGQVSDKNATRQYFYLNNGYRLSMISQKSFEHFAHTSVSFDSKHTSALEVILEKYVATTKPVISETYIKNEWKELKIKGTLHFKGILSVGNDKGIEGSLQMNADDSGVRYEFRESSFVISIL